MFLLRLPENVGRELTSLFLAKEASFPRISCPVSCCKKSVRRTVMASSIKLLLAIRILRYSFAVNLLILPKDVSLNPGPTGPSLHSSFSSFDSSITLDLHCIRHSHHLHHSIPQLHWKTAMIFPLISILGRTIKD